MTDVIFKTEQVTRKSWYNRIIQLMIEAGWQNLSSRQADNQVMFSSGENGKDNLLIQLRASDNATVEHENGIPYLARTQSYISFRLLEGYTPGGSSGSAGTFKTKYSFYLSLVMPYNFNLDQTFTLRYHCNKNRCIFISEFPPNIVDGGHDANTIIFIGKSDRTVRYDSVETGAIFASNVNNAQSYGILQYSTPEQTLGTTPLQVYHSFPTGMTANSPNDKVFVEEIPFGSDRDGIGGYFDGFYLTPRSFSCVTGDTGMDENGVEYRFINLRRRSSTLHYSMFDGDVTLQRTIAIRVK